MFSDVVAQHWQQDDYIWVHDYHLLLFPEIFRKRTPTAKIGFFLHIPFPSSEVSNHIILWILLYFDK